MAGQCISTQPAGYACCNDAWVCCQGMSGAGYQCQPQYFCN